MDGYMDGSVGEYMHICKKMDAYMYVWVDIDGWMKN